MSRAADVWGGDEKNLNFLTLGRKCMKKIIYFENKCWFVLIKSNVSRHRVIKPKGMALGHLVISEHKIF